MIRAAWARSLGTLTRLGGAGQPMPRFPSRRFISLRHRLLAMAVLSLLGLGTSGQPALAETPPPDYFTGVYERIGRTGGTNPGLLNDLWRIDPAPNGSFRLSSCTANSPEPAFDLRFTRLGDLENLLEGGTDGGLWCQFFNDGGNYPLLFCGAEDGRAFQMRVVTDDRAALCAAG